MTALNGMPPRWTVILAAAALLAACNGAPPGHNGQSPEPPAAEQTDATAEPAANDSAGDTNSAASAANQTAVTPEDVSACLLQDGKRLSVTPLHAVGTEPFWAADIKGRCVTYSHPENIDGTRVWTEYSALPNGGGTWSGALNGQKFELTARAEANCSDGMSDKRYPYAVDLLVGGERRRGCAERR